MDWSPVNSHWEFGVSNSPNPHVFGLWEEIRARVVVAVPRNSILYEIKCVCVGVNCEMCCLLSPPDPWMQKCPVGGKKRKEKKTSGVFFTHQIWTWPKYFYHFWLHIGPELVSVDPIALKAIDRNII